MTKPLKRETVDTLSFGASQTRYIVHAETFTVKPLRRETFSRQTMSDLLVFMSDLFGLGKVPCQTFLVLMSDPFLEDLSSETFILTIFPPGGRGGGVLGF